MANLKFQSLLWDVTRTKPALNLRPGVFYNGIEGFSIRVKEKNDEDRRTEGHPDLRSSRRRGTAIAPWCMPNGAACSAAPTATTCC